MQEQSEMYTPCILFVLGVLGILLHNLIQLNKLNRQANGKLNLIKYFKIEVYSIIISIIVVVVSVILSQEIASLEEVGNKLGLGFVAIGYMGQSLLVFFLNKFISTTTNDKRDDSDS